MSNDYVREQWKPVQFNFEYTNDFRLEVSNLGRIRTFNKISDGNIISGSMINGYRIIRLKLYRPRQPHVEAKLEYLKKQVLKLNQKIKQQKEKGEPATTIQESAKLLDGVKKNLSKKYQEDLKERTIHYHSLIHRLVAEYFLPKPAQNKTIVAHLDHDKLNNVASNLIWMTPDENYEHQKSSPHVIKDKANRKLKMYDTSKVAKLTVTKVMLLKKMLNQNKPIKQLVKQFKVTETQISRIKRGENWAEVPAAN